MAKKKQSRKDTRRRRTGKQNHRQIVVLGMHRSGTSALTGALSHMGIFVGDEDELTTKSWENAAGFFERRDARSICDALLHSSGADWWKVSAFDPNNVNHEALRVQRLAIRDLVGKLSQRGTWALKEPRLCFLLPLFQSALSDPLVVIPVRHPVEIARSLRRRNGFPIQAGLALWEAYVVSLLRVSWEIDRIFIDFHELVGDPQSTIAALADALSDRGIENLDLTAGAQSVQPALRRERFDASADGHLLTSAQAKLWADLSGNRRWSLPPQISSAAIAILREFEADEASRQEARSSIRSLTAKVAALQTSEAESKAAAQQRATEAKDAAKRLNEASARIETLSRDLTARNTTIESLKADLQSTRQSLERRVQTHESDSLELKALRQRIEEKRGRLERLSSELSARDSRVSLLRTEVAELQRRFDEQAARLRDEMRRAEDLRGNVSARDAQLSDRQVRVDQLLAQLAEQTDRLASAVTEIDALQASIKTLRASNAEYVDRLGAESVRAQALESELAIRDKVISDFRSRLADLETRYTSQGERLTLSVQENEEKRRQLSVRDEQLTALRADSAELRGRYAEQSANLEAERQRAVQLRDQVTAREAQIADQQSAQEALRVRLDEKEARLLEVHAKLEASRALLFGLRSELSELRGRYVEQADLLEKERRSSGALTTDLAARSLRVEELKSTLSNRLAQNEQQRAQFEEAERRSAELRANLAASDNARSELRAEIESLAEETARLKSELSSKTSRLSNLDYQHAKQTERLTDVTQRLKAERKRRRFLDGRVERLHARLEAQQAEFAAASARLSAIESSRTWRLASAIARVRRSFPFSGRRQPETREGVPPSATKSDDPRDPIARLENQPEELPTKTEGVSGLGSTASTPLQPRVTQELKTRLEVASRSTGRKLPLTALVITWDIGHNPLGRSYMLAEVIDRVVRHTVVVGFQFPRYGKSIWEPLRNSRIPVIRAPGQGLPDFIETVNHISNVVRPDVVIACKPRLPSLLLGLKIRERTGCPLILDIDDHELSFFPDQSVLTLDALEAMPKGSLRESVEPYGQVWTRLCESLVTAADARLVSNSALQERFGGDLVPHVRDESVFDRSAIADRSIVRRRLGIPPASKVVLFFGTPRRHKGVGALAEAVGQIADPNFRLVVVGRGSDPSVTAMLDQKAPGRVIELPNQPFSAIPEVLACADVVALPQEVDHPVSLYQLPAKAIDALAMGVPLLVSRTPPLMDLVRHKVATLIEGDDLAKRIEAAVREGVSADQAKARRDAFLNNYSYSAAAVKLRGVIENVLRSPAVNSVNIGERLETALKRATALERKASRAEPAGHDVVLFWKQNDTTLYGRRHDMVIKYLASRPDVRRVLVFDAPISLHKLLEFRDAAGQRTQHRHVYVRTEEKRLGLRDEGKILYRVFAYQPGIYGRHQEGRLALSEAYMQFLSRTFESEHVRADKSTFWFYPKDEFIPAIVRTFTPRRTVVDVVDDHRAWPNVSDQEVRWLTEHYREALTLADFVFANCEPVCASMREFFADVRLIPNGCDLDTTVKEPDDCPEFDRLKTWRGKIIGFVGNLESKIDVDLLHRVAAEFPECLLVLAGSTHANPNVEELARHANVLMPGVVPYEFVSAWITRFDVAIIPHRKSALTANMNPLKLFVYAAHQIPIVSTDVPNLDEKLENLFVARSGDEFIERVRAITSGRLALIGHTEYKLTNSWEARLRDAVDMVFNEEGERRVMIGKS